MSAAEGGFGNADGGGGGGGGGRSEPGECQLKINFINNKTLLISLGVVHILRYELRGGGGGGGFPNDYASVILTQ